MIPPRSVAALQHRNFRLIWIGLLFSMTGSMMQNAALLWQVSLLVPPDRKGPGARPGRTRPRRPDRRLLPDQRRGRRRVGPPQADALHADAAPPSSRWRWPWLTFRGVSAVWPIYALAALSSAVGAFDLPARQALLPMLVPREHLPNAISLNTTMMQTASVAGPALGGLMIAATGVGWAYVVNAISFGFVILALVAMRNVPAREPSQAGQRDDVSLHAALEGLRFVFRVAAHPIDDAARFLRDVLLVGDGAAADLRAGHPACRRRRVRLAVRGAGGRRARDERRAGAADRAHRTARRHAALGGRRLRRWRRSSSASRDRSG